MPNSETIHFPYTIGDVVEIKAPSFLKRRSQKTEDKLHVAAINYFDALVSLDKYSGKRFALVVANAEGYWADKVVIACPLTPCSVRSVWNRSPVPYVITPEHHIACGLDDDHIVAPSRLSVQTHWIRKKLGSVDTEFLSALPYEQHKG